MTTATADGTRDGDAARPAVRGGGWLTPTVIAFTTLVALGLRAYLWYKPGLTAITQYDDGPYFGSAVRLLHGAVPYRDFSFVQPPGITLLMTPVAALTYGSGTASGLILARFLTMVAGALAVVLAGLLVRHRGPFVTLITCGILAIQPSSAGAAHTLLLEPWLVLFCLAGALAVFDRDTVTTRTWRLAWGGAAFGFAGDIKSWAIIPVIVIFVLCLPNVRRALVFTAGVAAGFVIPALPFAALAPHAFYDNVVVAQLARIGARVPVWHRLSLMLGNITATAWPRPTVIAVALAVAIAIAAAQVLAILASRAAPPALDWFATVTAAGVVAIFLWPPYFASHYVAFLVPFLAMAIAFAAERLWSLAARLPGARQAGRRLWPVVAGLAAVGIVAAAVAQSPAHGNRMHPVPARAVARVVPHGSCVLSDQVSYLLLLNRFVSSTPHCPLMVDSLGTDLALSGGKEPGNGAARVPAVASVWRHAFQHAPFVLLSIKNSIRVPWTPALRAYFDKNFTRVFHAPAFAIYQRVSQGQ